MRHCWFVLANLQVVVITHFSIENDNVCLGGHARWQEGRNPWSLPFLVNMDQLPGVLRVGGLVQKTCCLVRSWAPRCQGYRFSKGLDRQIGFIL
jgi:hypothetical protein